MFSLTFGIMFMYARLFLFCFYFDFTVRVTNTIKIKLVESSFLPDPSEQRFFQKGVNLKKKKNVCGTPICLSYVALLFLR